MKRLLKITTLLGLLIVIAACEPSGDLLTSPSPLRTPTPVSLFQSPLTTPTAAPLIAPTTTSIPTATPIVVPPPPNWPTGEPWPPRPSTPNVLPTKTLQPPPAPKLSPIPKGPLPPDAKSLVFVPWDNRLTLASVKIGTDGTRWSDPQRQTALTLLASQLPQSHPPDYLVEISGIHPAPKGDKVAIDVLVYDRVQLWIASAIAGTPIPVTLPEVKDVQLISFLDWAPDGTQFIAYYSNRENGYLVVDALTGSTRKLDFPRSELGATLVQDVRYSPDGNTLAYVINTTTKEQIKGEIFLSSKDRTNPRLLHESPGVTIAGGSLGWSLDGQHLVYATTLQQFNDFASGEIRILDMNGNERVLVEHIPAFYTKPAWSPDSKRLAFVNAGSFSGNDLGPTEIAMVDVNTGKIDNLTTLGDRRNLSPKWSPNGRLIGFSSTLNTNGEIWLVDVDSRQSYPVAGPARPGTPLVWMP
jgi:dipeptidyl aminopeptidase/acylaminoacyl peptidase